MSLPVLAFQAGALFTWHFSALENQRGVESRGVVHRESQRRGGERGRGGGVETEKERERGWGWGWQGQREAEGREMERDRHREKKTEARTERQTGRDIDY